MTAAAAGLAELHLSFTRLDAQWVPPCEREGAWGGGEESERLDWTDCSCLIAKVVSPMVKKAIRRKRAYRRRGSRQRV